MSKSKFMVRQGDVLILDPSIVGAKVEAGGEVPRDSGRVVLAYGEVTGHAHAIKAPSAKLYDPANPPSDEAARTLGERILRSRTGMKLQHEEHSEIQIPAGHWLVRRQREYSPEALRTVAD
jgi:hypothetical protein